MRIYQRLKAKNDPNGNAQRLYVVYELLDYYWKIVAVYDEGNRGLPRDLHSLSQIPDVDISKSDYHSRYSMAQSTGILRYD